MPRDQSFSQLDDLLRMPLGDHLEDLRRRIILAAYGPIVVSIVTLYFGKSIVAWLLAPLARVLHQFNLPSQAYAFGVPTSFAVYIKVSLVAGVVIAFPWVCYQLWLFVSAGLYRHERKAVLLVAPFSAVMSLLGVLFLYYIMLPICLGFMVYFTTTFPAPTLPAPGEASWIDRIYDYSNDDPAANPITIDPANPATLGSIPLLKADPPTPSDGQVWLKLPERELRVYVGGTTYRFLPFHSSSVIQPMMDIHQYINFVTMLGLGVVIAFQVPVVMLILGWSGLVEPAIVSQYRKYCIFGCFVIGAVLTPADLASMFVLAVPLWTLFEFGLVLMRISYRREDPPMEL